MSAPDPNLIRVVKVGCECRVIWNAASQEQIVRCPLHAAAPELLAAIEYLFTPGPGIAVPTPYENDMKEPHKMTWNKKLERLQAALRTAKGEQP